MKAVRWVLIFLFYVAAELMSPVAVTPVEILEGEAELHQAGQRRVGRVVMVYDHPATDRRDVALRPTRLFAAAAPSPHRAWIRPESPRKIPAPVPAPPSAPDDH
jgi:hypothetical protein